MDRYTPFHEEGNEAIRGDGWQNADGATLGHSRRGSPFLVLPRFLIFDIVAEVIPSPYCNSGDITISPPFGLRCRGSQARKELSLVSSHESFLLGEINLAHDML